MSIKRKVAGEWRPVGLRYRKVNGQWRQVVKSFRKVNGLWKLVYSRTPHNVIANVQSLIGTYNVARRADGTIRVELNGKVPEGESAQVGIQFSGIPAMSSATFRLNYYKSIYQENDLICETSDMALRTFSSDNTNTSVTLNPITGILNIFINIRTSYTEVNTYFEITDLQINGVPV
jgi:hypothetical protein